MEICVEVLHKSTSYRRSSALGKLPEMFNTIHSSIIKVVSSSAGKKDSSSENNLLQFWKASIGRIKTSQLVKRTEIIKRATIGPKTNAQPGAIVTWGEVFYFVSKFHCAIKNDDMSRSFDSDKDESIRLCNIIHLIKIHSMLTYDNLISNAKHKMQNGQ